jgi:hypothetical protein
MFGCWKIFEADSIEREARTKTVWLWLLRGNPPGWSTADCARHFTLLHPFSVGSGVTALRSGGGTAA